MKNIIGFVAETTFGTRPGPDGLVGRIRPTLRRDTLQTFVGLRPYYRRTIRVGIVRLYFRDGGGNRFVIECGANVAAGIKPGVSYTVEQNWRKPRGRRGG